MKLSPDGGKRKSKERATGTTATTTTAAERTTTTTAKRSRSIMRGFTFEANTSCYIRNKKLAASE